MAGAGIAIGRGERLAGFRIGRASDGIAVVL